MVSASTVSIVSSGPPASPSTPPMTGVLVGAGATGCEGTVTGVGTGPWATGVAVVDGAGALEVPEHAATATSAREAARAMENRGDMGPRKGTLRWRGCSRACL